MYKVISEATIVGLIVFLIGKMIISFTVNKKNKSLPKGMNLAFFLTGFILHFAIELLGLNCWYCDKKCASQICNFIG